MWMEMWMWIDKLAFYDVPLRSDAQAIIWGCGKKNYLLLPIYVTQRSTIWATQYNF